MVTRPTFPKESYAELDNVQTIPKDRFVKFIGALDPATMKTIGRKLVLALGLEDCF